MKLHINFRFYWQVLKQAATDFMSDKVLKMSAALAYYTIFSIAPMMIIVIFLCDIFLGREAVEGKLFNEIQGMVGPEAAAQIQQMIQNASLSNNVSWATIVGVVTLIVGATGVFGEIQDSINTIWRLKAKPKKGFVKMIINRLLSFSLVISLGFILLVSLALNTLMEVMSDRLFAFFPEAEVVVVYIANIVITLIIISLLFAIIFKVLPDAKIQWKHVLVGAVATAILFMLGKFGIGLYMGMSKVGTTYGAAGSIVIILLWVYYSSAILYFGAEFTRSWVEKKGCEIEPNDYAIWVKQVEVASDGIMDERKTAARKV
ncbi:YihY/virulence factor BrkB family protein [Chitinophaga sedimenti]|uniref:YihY/virulence factor BrkB family protein n=1 Tax=Chitinophaga sedimenti TaxID=2033606 RepID=UPI0020044B1D|nr:YihY/virulence factor BrkB family protein [Chitinophaga sedimenti]MCK7558985.1 YihY/virulence factor BrkB family protein [Chitinophaga sedimenti]